MKPLLLDNDQINRIHETSEMAAQVFDSIRSNHAPYGILIENAICDAAPQFFMTVGDNLFEYSPALAKQAYDTAARIQEIIREGEVYE